ncbi:hypothetical protein Taro_034652 [Colocasia esculenta]|uniref:Uncharacterized protein n=1 Tax=Colocasia esculenta TaxID=4460 RepID=A0A843VYA4_COLES|nr:hypothetical protein [Colocasia esculenta]
MAEKSPKGAEVQGGPSAAEKIAERPLKGAETVEIPWLWGKIAEMPLPLERWLKYSNLGENYM